MNWFGDRRGSVLRPILSVCLVLLLIAQVINPAITLANNDGAATEDKQGTALAAENTPAASPEGDDASGDKTATPTPDSSDALAPATLTPDQTPDGPTEPAGPVGNSPQAIAFLAYSPDEAPIDAFFMGESYADGTLAFGAILSVGGDESVTSVYDGLSLQVSGAGGYSKSQTVPALGAGGADAVSFTAENIAEEDLDAFCAALTLTVSYKGEEVASLPLLYDVESLKNGMISTLDAPEDEIPALVLSILPSSSLPIEDGTISILSGRDALMQYIISTSAVEAAVVAIPVSGSAYMDIAATSVYSEDVSYGLVQGLSFTYQGNPVTGDFYVVTIPNSGGSGSTSGFVSNFSMSFKFKNGLTPAGVTESVGGYILQGELVTDGSGLLGGDVNILAGGEGAMSNNAFTLKAEVNETLTAEKSLYSVSDGAVLFSELVERSYNDVVTAVNDDYVVTYRLRVKTSGDGESYGRLYQDYVKVEDTLSGFLAAGKPKSVEVFDAALNPMAVTPAVASITGTSYTFSFDVPVNANTALSNQEYTVKVVYSKNDYTNKYNEAAVLSSPQAITNKARILHKATVGAAATTAYSADVTHAFGYVQEKPTTPTLNIYQRISVSGQTYVYNSEMQSAYGSATSPLTYRLTPTSGSGTTVLTATPDENGYVRFANLVPDTTYTLSTAAPISSAFETVAGVQVVVSALNATGVATVTVDGVNRTSTDHPITSLATGIGVISVQVEKQKLYQFPSVFENFTGALVELKQGATAVATGTSDQQGKVLFHNVSTSVNYTLTGAAAGNEYITPTLGSVTASATGIESYKLQYASNVGSFKLGKNFVGPDGSAASVSNFVAKFQLYTTTGTPVGDEITITSATPTIVQQNYEAGTYILKETSLTVGGVSANAEYPLYTGEDVKVTIVKGSYGAVPEDTGGRADANGVFTNVSAYGQLIIRSFGFDGNALNGFSYTIKGVTDASFSRTVSISSGGKASYFLPDGTYTVTQADRSGYLLLTNNTITVTVAAGVAAVDNLSVTGTGAGETRALSGSATSKQTVGFLSAVLPDIQTRKSAADDSARYVSGARFALYVLEGGNYVPYLVNGSQYTVSSTSSGYITFADIPVGSYALVEMATPSGYITPAYVANFMDNGTLKASVTVSAASGAPKAVVAYGDYSHTVGVYVGTTGGNLSNTRYAGLTIRTITTTTGAAINGATYTLYNSSGVAIAQASPTGSGYVSFYRLNNGTVTSELIRLTAGDYTIRQTAMTGAALDYVQRKDEITIRVNLDGGMVAPVFGADYNRTTAMRDAVNNEYDITFSNPLRPSMNIRKWGETNVFDDSGERVKEVLAGAKFIVHFTDTVTATKYYAQFDSTGRMTGITDNRSEATEITADAYGELPLLFMDAGASLTYTLEEIWAPAIAGTDLTYKMGSWHFNFTYDNTTTYGYIINTTAAELNNGFYNIYNKVDAHYLYLLKSRLRETSAGSGVYIEVGGASAINGVFEIYAWDDDLGAYDMSEPVDTIITGKGDLDKQHTAFSRQLPVGKYLVVETVAPIGAASPTGDSAILFVKEGANWIKKNAVNGVLSFEVELSDNDPGGIHTAEIGNLEAGGGSGSTRYARLYAEKVGYAMDIDGVFGLRGPIMGVQFEVWLAYKDAAGKYQKLGTEAYETVSSGSVYINHVLQPGQFLTSYISYGHFTSRYMTAMGVDQTAAEAAEYGFILVELGPLPTNYRPITGTNPEFAYAIDFGKATGGTITVHAGTGDDDLKPHEVANTAGEGFLRVLKYGSDNQSLELAGATFEVYRATTAEPTAQRQYIGTISPVAGNAVINTHSMLPGYYYLQEITSPSGYNALGTYQVGNAAAEAFTGTIGPIIVRDSTEPVVVKVFDKKYAKLTIRNYWDSGVAADVAADYTITQTSGSGFTAQNLTVGYGGATITGLTDGTYLIKQTVLGGTRGGEYHPNAAARDTGITITVQDGDVIAIAVGGAPVAIAANGTAAGNRISRTMDYTYLDVNHVSRGALIIKKGYIDASGHTVYTYGAEAGLAAATFELQKHNGSAWVAETTLNWTYGEHASAGLKTLFNAGRYRIREMNTSTGYNVDDAWVYFTIEDAGIVYLQNNSSAYGEESSESNPLTATNSGTQAYFYNSINLGAFSIYKLGSATATTYLAGAAFEVYANNNGVPGAKVEAVFTGSDGVYTTSLTPGTYYIKETQAPAGYDVREGYTRIVVLKNTAPKFAGYGSNDNVNALGLLNAQTTSLTVAKQTTYPEVKDGGGTVLLPAVTSRVAGLPLELYKHDGTAFVKISGENVATLLDNDASIYGSYTFSGLGAGTYRVLEKLPADGKLSYLSLNSVYAQLNNSPDIVITYDEGTNSLKIESTAAGEDFDETKNLLTIDNAFIGVRFAAKKTDYDTGAPVEGAQFKLYATLEDAIAGENEISSAGHRYTTGADGIVYFDPMYLSAGTTYYIKEAAVPTPYVIDAFYDDIVKPVTVSAEGTQVMAAFRNKSIATGPVNAVTKTTDTIATTALRHAALNATFTITPAAPNNALPLTNYKVTDAGFTFYGEHATLNQKIAITGTQPTYSMDSVRIYPATSKATPTAIDELVYVKVNGGSWTKLAAPYTEIPLNGAQALTVLYASAIPAEGADPGVGIEFTPGKIELLASFDKFEPASDGSQPEVTRITNTVGVNADYRNAPLSTVAATANLEVPVDERPAMSVAKTCNTIDQKKPGEALEYAITLKNEAAEGSGLVIKDPVIVDVMQQNAMYIDVDASGSAIYSVSGAATADDAVFATAQAGRIAMWTFTGIELAPQASITVTFTARLEKIITTAEVTNTAYGTSAAVLSHSNRYPTGASFVAYSASAAISSGSEYTLLESVTKISGLYVKSATPETTIKRSGQINVQRSISTDGQSWSSSEQIPAEVYPGDTVYYRLQVQNDELINGGLALTNVTLADILPYNGDSKFTQGSRGTEWTNAFLDLVALSGGITVTNNAGEITDFTVKYSTARTLSTLQNDVVGTTEADANSFLITFGNNVEIAPGDVLTVVFAMQLPAAAGLTEAMLDANVGKTANASFLPLFTYGGTRITNTESNVVKAVLRADKVGITGTVFDDTDRDGTMEAGESGIAGVEVALYVSTDGGVTSSIVGAPAMTDADGSYTFTGLDASYGASAPIYKVVVTNPDAENKQFSPGVAYDGTADDKSHIVAVAAGAASGDTGWLTLRAGATVNAGINDVERHSVSYLPGTAGASAGNIPAASTAIKKGATYTVLGSAPGEPTWDGYTFMGWQVTSDASNALSSSYLAGATFTMPNNDVELTAIWQRNTWKVTYVSEGTGVPQAAPNVPALSTYTVSSTVPANGTMAFKGWLVTSDTSGDILGGTYASSGEFTMPNNDVVLTAQWNDTHQVLYDGNGADAASVPTDGNRYEAGDGVTVSMVKPTLYGYTFTGWKVTSDASGAILNSTYQPEAGFSMPGNTVTLSAQWRLNTWEVAYSSALPGAVDIPAKATGVQALSSYSISSAVPKLTNYVFEGWEVVSDTSNTLDAEYDAGESFKMPDNNVELQAIWAAVYTVTYDANGGDQTTAPVDTNAYKAAADVTIPDVTPTRYGYTFAGWQAAQDPGGVLAGIYWEGGTFSMPAHNVTFLAKWDLNTYNVTYQSVAGTTNMPQTSEDVDALSTYTISDKVPVNGNKAFKGWKMTDGWIGGMALEYAAGGSFTMPDSDVELTAIWADTYQVFYDGNGADGNVPSDSTYYEEGDGVTVSTDVPTRYGFTFAGWKVASDPSGSLDAAYASNDPFDMPGNDVTLEAMWTANFYTVTYRSTGDTANMPDPATVLSVKALSTFDVSGAVPARFGYNFKGWEVTDDASATLNASYAASSSFEMPDNDVELTAIWEPTYTVTYIGNGALATSVPEDTDRYEAGETVSISAQVPTRYGYTFDGWEVGDASGTLATGYDPGDDFSMPGNHVTLTATWKINLLTVTYKSKDGTTNMPDPHLVENVEALSEHTVSPTVPVYNNEAFKGWVMVVGWVEGLDTEHQPGASFTMPDSHVELEARWADTFRVLYDGNGADGNVPSDGAYYEEGDTVTVSMDVPTRYGYTFGGWEVVEGGSAAMAGEYDGGETFGMPANNVGLKAIWTLNSWSVAYKSTADTADMPDPATDTGIDALSTYTVSSALPLRFGYAFKGWEVTAGKSATMVDEYAIGASFDMPDNDVELTAIWAPTYTVTYIGNGALPASVPVDADRYEAADPVTVSLSEPTRAGYTFTGWAVTLDVSGGLTGPYDAGSGFNMPNNNVELTAQWRANFWNVTYTSTSGTANMPEPATLSVQALTEVSVSAAVPTRTDYIFKGWQVTEGISAGMEAVYQAGGSFTMPDNDVELTAMWNPTYQVFYDGNGADGNVPDDAAYYEAGDPVTVSGQVPTRYGYSFMGWEVAVGGAAGMKAEYKSGEAFDMPANDVGLKAVWELNSWTVTYASAAGATNMPGNATDIDALSTYGVSTVMPLRFGYNFKGWQVTSGKSAAMSDTYATGGSFQMPDNDVELTAIWAPTYTIAYNGAGADASSMPVDTNRYEAQENVPVSGMIPTRAGYTFAGWEVTGGRTGAMQPTYGAGSSFPMPGNNVELTAMWDANFWEVRYLSTTDTTGMPAPATESVQALTTHTLSATVPVRTGYNFKGWEVTAGWAAGMQASYRAAEAMAMPDNDVTLTAIWARTYTVTYNGNGAATASVPVDTSRYEAGDTVTLSSMIPNHAAGLMFEAWQVVDDASATLASKLYAPGATLTMPANDITLIVRWYDPSGPRNPVNPGGNDDIPLGGTADDDDDEIPLGAPITGADLLPYGQFVVTAALFVLNTIEMVKAHRRRRAWRAGK